MVLFVLAWWSEGVLKDKVGFLIKQVGNLVIEPTIPESWSGFFAKASRRSFGFLGVLHFLKKQLSF